MIGPNTNIHIGARVEYIAQDSPAVLNGERGYVKAIVPSPTGWAAKVAFDANDGIEVTVSLTRLRKIFEAAPWYVDPRDVRKYWADRVAWDERGLIRRLIDRLRKRKPPSYPVAPPPQHYNCRCVAKPIQISDEDVQ